jgi:2-oxoglutarate dehydrogenase E1 component
MMLVRAHAVYGHLNADLDPLHLQEVYKKNSLHNPDNKFKFADESTANRTDYRKYGFTEADLEKEFYIDYPYGGGLLSQKKTWVLKELLAGLDNAYQKKIGVDFMHIPSVEQCEWIRNKFELKKPLPDFKKRRNFERFLWGIKFAKYIAQKFNTQKRFGLEGLESVIPGLKLCCDTLSEMGANKILMGMPHRGRLNVLSNVVQKPLETIFAEFQGIVPNTAQDTYIASGDVKYHLGTSYTKSYEDGRKLTISVLANPSHLECVNPVVMGRVRAEQHYDQDKTRTKVVPILLHGDAAFAGQGVVYETMQMQDLTNYGVGGTIHVICNNQIGFTTTPDSGRTGHYSTDLAKAINAPIFHVNADDVDEVCRVFIFAA